MSEGLQKYLESEVTFFFKIVVYGGYIMSKSKRIIFWVICYILSFLSLFIAFPILLFSFYPYSIIAVAVYVVAIVVLSVFSFLKNNNKHKILKKLLFGVMLLPVIALLTILVSIEAGWLHYPG